MSIFHRHRRAKGEKPPSRTHRTLSLRRVISQFWLVEILSWLISLVLFGAIIGLLAGFDDHSIPAWRWGITLGTLVSLLATFATFTIAVPLASSLGQLKWIWFYKHERPLADFYSMEKASKGPGGSFLLILKWKGGVLAVIGALLTILTLAINPFVQQVIIYDSKLVNVTEAFIPIARTYHPPENAINSALMTNPPMVAAIYNGFLNFNATPSFFDITPQCPTGNCTWPLYNSLAICSSCEDLTPRLVREYAEDGWSFNDTLPNGLTLQTKFPTPETAIFLNVSMIIRTAMDNYSSIAFPDKVSAGSLVDFFAIIGAFDENDPLQKRAFDSNESVIASAPGPFAAECILNFCNQSYTAASSNGIFHEQRSPLPLIYNITDALDWNLIPYTDLYYFREYLTLLFTVDVLWTKLSNHPPFPNAVSQSMWRSFRNPPHTLNQVMANTAQSMTRQMRSYNNTGTDIALGQAFAEQSFIRIDWPWMAFPLTLLLAILVFLIVVAIHTQNMALEVWRDNDLASLFHGLDENARKMVAAVNFEEEIDTAAETMVVRLEKNDRKGWELKLA